MAATAIRTPARPPATDRWRRASRSIPFWPRPLPNHWILGPAIGVAVDSRDHVWIVHRNTPGAFGAINEIGAAQDPPLSECCIPAPPVLEFDPDGNLVGHWGGPSETGEYEWPTSNHGILVDHMDNVWIGRQRRRRLARAEVHP